MGQFFYVIAFCLVSTQASSIDDGPYGSGPSRPPFDITKVQAFEELTDHAGFVTSSNLNEEDEKKESDDKRVYKSMPQSISDVFDYLDSLCENWVAFAPKRNKTLPELVCEMYEHMLVTPTQKKNSFFRVANSSSEKAAWFKEKRSNLWHMICDATAVCTMPCHPDMPEDKYDAPKDILTATLDVLCHAKCDGYDVEEILEILTGKFQFEQKLYGFLYRQLARVIPPYLGVS